MASAAQVEGKSGAANKEQLMMLADQPTMQLWIHMLANDAKFKPTVYLDFFRMISERRLLADPREKSVLIYQVCLPRREGKFYHVFGSCKRVRQVFDLDNARDFFKNSILAMQHVIDGDMLCCEFNYGGAVGNPFELALMDNRSTLEQLRNQWMQANFRPERSALYNVEVRCDPVENDSDVD